MRPTIIVQLWSDEDYSAYGRSPLGDVEKVFVQNCLLHLHPNRMMKTVRWGRPPPLLRLQHGRVSVTGR